MRLTGNPKTFGRAFSIIIMFMTTAVACMILLSKMDKVTPHIDLSLPLLCMQLLAMVFTVLIQLYSLYLKRHVEREVRPSIFTSYIIVILLTTILSQIFEPINGGFIFIGIGLFSLIASGIVISSRDIKSIEKVGPFGMYEVRWKD